MKVGVIVVLYQPPEGCAEQWVGLFRQSGIHLIMVDNTPDQPHSEHDTADCAIIRLGKNVGIAAAQNIGLAKAGRSLCDVVVFLDQDTQIKPAQLNNMRSAAVQASRHSQVVVPVFCDARYGFEYPTIQLSRWGLRKKIYAGGRNAVFHTDLVISSGTVVPVHLFDQTGGMDEALFIDYVDTEWCLRCRQAGIHIVVDPAWVLQHRIGEYFINLKFMRIPVHKPVRRFYRIRNSFWLLDYPHVPKLLALREVLAAVMHQLIIIGFAGEKKAQTLTLMRGVRAGISGLFKKRR